MRRIDSVCNLKEGGRSLVELGDEAEQTLPNQLPNMSASCENGLWNAPPTALAPFRALNSHESRARQHLPPKPSTSCKPVILRSGVYRSHDNEESS